jgi:hypothetical protein
MCSGEATRASRTSAGGTPPQEETLALRTVGVGRQRQCRTHPTDGRNSGEDPCVSPLWAPNRPSPHEHSLGARRQDWVASKCSHAPQVGRDQGKPECNLKNNPMAYRRGGSPRRLSSLAWVTGRGPRVTGASPAWYSARLLPAADLKPYLKRQRRCCRVNIDESIGRTREPFDQSLG